jgi:hypothetical protein
MTSSVGGFSAETPVGGFILFHPEQDESQVGSQFQVGMKSERELKPQEITHQGL